MPCLLPFCELLFVQGNTNFIAFRMKPVKDFNELTHHFIECIYVHVRTRKEQETPNTKVRGTLIGQLLQTI